MTIVKKTAMYPSVRHLAAFANALVPCLRLDVSQRELNVSGDRTEGEAVAAGHAHAHKFEDFALFIANSHVTYKR